MSHTDATLTGASLIAGEVSAQGTETFQATDPSTGRLLPTSFHESTIDEVNRAATAAAEAFTTLRSWTGEQLGALLRACSEQLMALGDTLLETAKLETGLGEARLVGERARTCAQFEMFADLVESGEHLDVIIDHADPDATPPRPDLRRMKIGVGPVAVFGASNFPFAFSVPGGDTASALAAGCPVVIKSHPSHPATSELAAKALRAAADQTGAPAGTINLVHGHSNEVGRALVLADEIRSVGFTGSARGGRALHDLAASREHPIPVHAEMGSLNPVLITERALDARSGQIATDFVASLTMGVGQFCTSPGLIFVPEGDAGDGFITQVADQLRAIEPGPLLNQGIRKALATQLAATTSYDGVSTLVDGTDRDTGGTYCAPTLLSVDLDLYLEQPAIREEHFGPVAVIVRCPADTWDPVLSHLDGQLTVTLMAEEDDAAELAVHRAALSEVAGRVSWNAFPTGVAVTAAQHHGGPYPATSDPRYTSVGTTAIERFLRPVAYQNAPEAFLPPELHDSNPAAIPQRVDGGSGA